MDRKQPSEWGQDDNAAQSPRIAARKRLYCFETLSGLDDIRHTQCVSNLSRSESLKKECAIECQPIHLVDSEKPRETIKFVSKNQQKDTLDLKTGQDFLQNKDTTSCKTIDKRQRDGKFAKGLLNEFTKYHNGYETPNNNKVNTLNKERWPTTSVINDEQTVPDITLEQQDTDIDDKDDDVLIIHDDIMTSSDIDSDSGSDIDWSSLTPPAPRSPSDQRVPEIEDKTMKNVLRSNELHNHLPNQDIDPFYSLYGISMFDREQPSYSIYPPTQQAPSSDHVVPQFSGHL